MHVKCPAHGRGSKILVFVPLKLSKLGVICISGSVIGTENGFFLEDICLSMNSFCHSFIQVLLCQSLASKNQDEVQVQIKFKAWLLKMWVTLAKHLTSELPQFHSFMHAFIFC